MPQRFFKMAVDGFPEGQLSLKLPTEDRHLFKDGKVSPEAVFAATLDELQKVIHINGTKKDSGLSRNQSSEQGAPPGELSVAHGVVRNLIVLHAWASVLGPKFAISKQRGETGLHRSVEHLGLKLREAGKAVGNKNVHARQAILSVGMGLFLRSAMLKRVSKDYKKVSASIRNLRKESKEVAELDELCWQSLQAWAHFESALKMQRRYIKFCGQNHAALSELRLLFFAFADPENEDAAFFLELANTVFQAEQQGAAAPHVQQHPVKRRKAAGASS